MFIGAAPGSTGGGIKVTTIVVIVMTAVSVLKNKEETTVLGRRVDRFVVYKAITITMLSMTAIFAASMSIYFSLSPVHSITGIDSVFESVSAFATVGLSAGVTSYLNLFSEILLVFIMFLGRVGPISVVLSLTMKSDDRSKKQIVPEGKILVG
jgi:trk system potassium uptake protein TrkH